MGHRLSERQAVDPTPPAVQHQERSIRHHCTLPRYIAVIAFTPETHYMATIPLQYVASLSHLNVSGYTVIVDVVAGCRLSVRVFDAMPRNRGQAVVGVVVAVQNGV